MKHYKTLTKTKSYPWYVNSKSCNFTFGNPVISGFPEISKCI